jgi:hypothetical protein
MNSDRATILLRWALISNAAITPFTLAEFAGAALGSPSRQTLLTITTRGRHEEDIGYR